MDRNRLPSLFIVALAGAIASPASAAIYDFHFTGRLTVLAPDGGPVPNPESAGAFDPYGLQTPITSTLRWDTGSDQGVSGLILAPVDFLGSDQFTAQIHDVTLYRIGVSSLILGNLLIDWGDVAGIPASIVWDSGGLFGAFSLAPGGLQEGDVISGTRLLRDGDVIVDDLGSATPATDGPVTFHYINGGTDSHVLEQGPAPLATSTWNTETLCDPGTDCMGSPISGGTPLWDDGIAGSPLVDGPFPGYSISLDIGSGNSLTVTGVNAVPLPSAVWFFASGLGVLSAAAGRRRLR